MNMTQRIDIGLILLIVLSACAQKPPKIEEAPPNRAESRDTTDDAGEDIESLAPEDASIVEEKQPSFDYSPPQSEDLEKATEQKPLPQSEPPKILWERIVSLYELPQKSDSKTRAELRWLLKHPGYLDRVQQRAEPFLFEIVEQVEKHGLPGEIALLPIIESAFRPHAYSSERAVGIWQFIPGTGRQYGLNQNWWYDGRRDIYASTHAAILYLKRLRIKFGGDWLLAIAAYNSGEGTVARAVRRNRRNHRPANFWHLRLPRETRYYVPRLLAIAKVIQNADEYRIKLRPIPDKRVIEAVDVGTQLDLGLAAELAGMSLEEIYRLNPGFNQWATAPSGPHRLMLPIEKSEIFKAKLSGLNEQARVKWTRHTIKKGETLGHIALKYRTPVSVLRQVNKIRGHIIRPDNNLMIPLAKLDRAFYQQERFGNRFARSHPTVGREQIVYTVRNGDSFWKIARKYSVSMKKLALWNNMSYRMLLRPGKKLTIWMQPQRTANVVDNSTNPFDEGAYTVKKGDSLYRISRRFNVKIADLRKWNAERLGKYLKPGQKLKVREDVTEPAT